MKRKIFVLFVALTGASVGMAQTKLSLQDAVGQAVQTHPLLKAEAERIAAAQGLKRQAELRPNPEVQFQNENLRPGQTYSTDVDSVATISHPLDILGKRRERIAAASEGISRAQADLSLVRWQLSQRIKLAYWSARGAQEIANTWKATLVNFQQIVDYHAAQLSAGAIAEQDYLRVQLEGERLKLNAQSAQLDASRALAELYRQMGQSYSGEVELTEPLATSASVAALPLDEVLAQREEIKAVRAALEQARANTRLQNVAARPDLNILYGYKRTQLFDTATGVNTAIAAIRITLPMSDRNQGNRIAAEADVRRQEQLLAAAEADVRAEYYGALQEFKTRQGAYSEQLQTLRTRAAEIANIANAAYREGGTDLLRFLDAERARLDAEIAWARGMAELRQSMARLEAAEGVN